MNIMIKNLLNLLTKGTVNSVTDQDPFKPGIVQILGLDCHKTLGGPQRYRVNLNDGVLQRWFEITRQQYVKLEKLGCHRRLALLKSVYRFNGRAPYRRIDAIVTRISLLPEFPTPPGTLGKPRQRRVRQRPRQPSNTIRNYFAPVNRAKSGLFE